MSPDAGLPVSPEDEADRRALARIAAREKAERELDARVRADLEELANTHPYAARVIKEVAIAYMTLDVVQAEYEARMNAAADANDEKAHAKARLRVEAISNVLTAYNAWSGS